MYFKNRAAEFVYTRTYSRWVDELGRRETWPETVERYLLFIEKHTEGKLPPKVIKKARAYILNFDVMPSMRAMWAAGPAAEADNTTIFNCSFAEMDSIDAFSECLYILMCGTGFGFSVTKESVDKLPTVAIAKPESNGTMVITDDRRGWADSVKALLVALYDGKNLDFDYSYLRPKGARLKTMGGRSSGPEPLMGLHKFIKEVFDKAQGRKLTTLEVHDICNKIAEIVVVGGVRRSSQISLSDLDDEAMRLAKMPPFPAHRYMANNSAIYYKKPSAVEFLREWSALASSGSGERGIFNLEGARNKAPTRRKAELIRGTNPCSEILLRNNEFCNLSEVVVRAEDDLDTLLDKVETATWLGAIQSTFTHHPYLRDSWKNNSEEERLLGVSLTGQMDNPDILTPETLKAMKKKAIKVARHASEKLGINMPAAITCTKPSGCRPFDGLVTTKQGIYTLEDLIVRHHSETKKDWAEVNKYSTYGAGKITKTYLNGNAEVFKITASFGMELESTANHQWYIKDKGFVRTDKLVEGDVLDIQSNIYDNKEEATLITLNERSISVRGDAETIIQPSKMNPELAWFLGYLWGDGAMSPVKYRIRFIDERVENLEKASRIIKEQFGLDTKIHSASEHRNAKTLEVGSKLLWHWLIKNDIWKYYKDNIDLLPLKIRESSKESIIAFISGIFDADGWFGYDSIGKGRATLTTASSSFSTHVQHIGWSVGLCFGKSKNGEGDNFQKRKEMYLMCLLGNSNKDSLNIFKKHSNKVTGNLGAENPQKIYKAGVIKSIESVGVKPTFDVETDEHWFYAGAVKSHNTVSQVVDSASGLHTRYSEYYIRRYRISSTDPLCKLLKDQGAPMKPEVGQSEDTATTWVVEFPVKAPEGCITRKDMSAIKQLEHYKKIQNNWCEHSASATIYVKDDEWFEVGNWVYANWEYINGVSFLPYDGGIYKLAPYEEITAKQYVELSKKFPEIDYSKLSAYELEDQTEGAQNLACVSGVCEI